VQSGFRGSLQERERIVSTMLGDGIALPHSLGLLARRTLVYTVLAPRIDWGNGERYPHLRAGHRQGGL
jgi:mannitol/fructose-specific phosphotransferase system IIA component